MFIQNNLTLRSRVIGAVREWFRTNGFFEVETPIRIPAPAPEAHIEAEPAGDWYLQTSPELCMKRLLAAGYENIFQICRAFRKGERGLRHLPEFTLLEWYSAGRDYTHMMGQCEELIRHVAKNLGIGNMLSYQGKKIRLQMPWTRVTVEEAFERYAPVSMNQAVETERFDLCIAEYIEPGLMSDRPTFLYDYPIRHGALARPKAGHPHIAERFELYMGGLELCNAFSELNDPVEQKRRFVQEKANRIESGHADYPLPEKFLMAMNDMPTATGNALGIDRLVMLFADTADIAEVVAFTPEEL